MSFDSLELYQEAVERNNKKVFKFLLEHDLKYGEKEELPFFAIAAIQVSRDIFLLAYEKLNSEQRKALVEHIEDPDLDLERRSTVLRWIRGGL